jgi:hypothetical protein
MGILYLCKYLMILYMTNPYNISHLVPDTFHILRKREMFRHTVRLNRNLTREIFQRITIDYKFVSEFQ